MMKTYEKRQKINDDMTSGEIQDYAMQQLDVAQEQLFSDNVPDEEVIKVLDNVLEAMKQLPVTIEQEEQEVINEPQEMDRISWDMAKENLTEDQIYMSDLLKEDYPEIDLDCIYKIYAKTPDDYDRVDDNVAAFSRFLKKTDGFKDQKSLFDDFFYQEQSDPLDLEQLYRDFSEDFPNVEKYLIPALCQKAGTIDEMMDRVNDFSLYIDGHKGHRQDELFAAFISGKELPKTMFQSLKDRFLE